MASSYCGELLQNAALAPGFCAHAIPLDFERPRSILAIGTSDFLVFERGTSAVVAVFDSNGDGVPDQRVTTEAQGGNHGMAYYNGHLYVSSDTTVWRWEYEFGSTAVVDGSSRETVIVNMNADGQGGAPEGHTTRTLAFSAQGKLYISVGSADNVDEDSYRSRIRRFDIADEASLPFDFQLGEVFADGLRNEVGLAFDRHGILWGVENGADDLFRDDLGGSIVEDNPAEELNRFPEELAGSHWGYPECWTEFDLTAQGTGLGRGTVWAWPDFMEQGVTDDMCRSDRVASEMAMQAHSAPLGIAFYNYTRNRPDGCTGAFPEEMDGYAFIAFHGSWNRDVPTGYKVVYVPMTADGQVDDSSAPQPIDLLRHDSEFANWNSGLRPVDVDFDQCGRLLVTSDGTNGEGSDVLRIAYDADNGVDCCGQASPVIVDGADPPAMVTDSPSPEPIDVTPTTGPLVGEPMSASHGHQGFETTILMMSLLVIMMLLR